MTRWWGLFLFLLVGCTKTETVHVHHHETDENLPQMSTEVGAGGSGVLCGATPTSAAYFETMDVYEARKRNMPPELGAKDLPVTDKIEIALKRLAVFSPLRADRYRKRVAEIREKALYFTRGYLPHIGDDDPANLEEGCKIVQIATRRKPLFPNDPEFLFDQRLLSQLDNDNQAVLYLHEAAYEEASTQFHHATSRFTRGVISLFFSTHIEKMTRRSFIEFLAKAEFHSTDFAGLEIPTQIADADSTRAGTTRMEGERILSASWEVRYEGSGSIPFLPISYFGKKLWMGGGINQEAAFSEAGKLVALWGIFQFDEEVLVDRGNELRRLSNKHPALREGLTVFDDQGRLRLLQAGKGSKLRLADKEGLTELDQVTCISLNPEGVVTLHSPSPRCTGAEIGYPIPAHWN